MWVVGSLQGHFHRSCEALRVEPFRSTPTGDLTDKLVLVAGGAVSHHARLSAVGRLERSTSRSCRACCFGLSTDYNVFLLSRIRDAYNAGHRARESVIHGMGRIGKGVVCAGLIMAAVFMSFVTASDTISKMFGLGLGLAILIDVLIVRMVIAPAVVKLLGDRAWWPPAWLDRARPSISLEGRPESGEIEADGDKLREREKVMV